MVMEHFITQIFHRRNSVVDQCAREKHVEEKRSRRQSIRRSIKFLFKRKGVIVPESRFTSVDEHIEAPHSVFSEKKSEMRVNIENLHFRRPSTVYEVEEQYIPAHHSTMNQEIQDEIAEHSTLSDLELSDTDELSAHVRLEEEDDDIALHYEYLDISKEICELSFEEWNFQVTGCNSSMTCCTADTPANDLNVIDSLEQERCIYYETIDILNKVIEKNAEPESLESNVRKSMLTVEYSSESEEEENESDRKQECRRESKRKSMFNLDKEFARIRRWSSANFDRPQHNRLSLSPKKSKTQDVTAKSSRPVHRTMSTRLKEKLSPKSRPFAQIRSDQ